MLQPTLELDQSKWMSELGDDLRNNNNNNDNFSKLLIFDLILNIQHSTESL